LSGHHCFLLYKSGVSLTLGQVGYMNTEDHIR